MTGPAVDETGAQPGGESTDHSQPDQEKQIPEAKPSPAPPLTGWRLALTVPGLLLGVFFSTMEISIVSTALVDITNELGVFQNNAWIINAYLVTYTGFLIVWAQFSHIGRKRGVEAAYLLFIVFSIGCARAQDGLTLIILRAFQGIGGAGVFNMSMVVLVEAVLPAEFPKYTAYTSMTYMLSYGLGPLIGGAISNTGNWRWVFWINVIGSLIPLLLLEFGLPNRFPHHNGPVQPRNRTAALRKLDYGGALLFLATSILLVTALQGADVSWAWSSATSICLLVFFGVAGVLFYGWERYITKHSEIVPVLTYKFCTRKALGMFMSFFLVSGPFISTMVQLPQRLQILNGLGPFDAGVRLLPFIAVIPFVSFLASIYVSRYKIKHAYALLVGVGFEIIGIALFATMLPNDGSDSDAVPHQIYGFQIILAVGLGINNTLLVTAVPYMVAEKSLIPSGVGSGMQFRYLGGAVGLGLTTAVFNAYVQPHLQTVVSPSQLAQIIQTSDAVSQLSPAVQAQVRTVFAQGFRQQWLAMLAFGVAQVPTALLML